MIKNIHRSDEEKQFGTIAREKSAQKNGSHATFYYANGDQYLGEWKNGCREGKGKHIYKNSGLEYLGEWKGDVRDGHGILSLQHDPIKSQLLSNKSKLYVGNWKNDKKDGLGTFYYPDASFYEGNWKNDSRQGHGKMSYADGTVYEGEWDHDKRHGRGTLNLPNGDRYEGMWSEDKKEGPGTFTYMSKRQCYTGEWSKGQARCGTIHNLPPLPGHDGTKYPLPVIGLEDPKGILEAEKQLIASSRAKGMVS